MRRPPPLPTNPDDEAVADRVADRRGRRGDVPRPADGGPGDDRPEVPVNAGEEGAGSPTSSRDVWRAARARRKALRAEIRRFTQRSRRRRVVGWSAVGVAAVLIGGSVAAAYSPLFAVERITVVGASSIDPATLEAALGDQIGTPLALVDSSEVKAALLGFPLIETYSLEARPPHELAVRIVERTPIGVLQSEAGFTLVDAAGVALSTTADQPAGQPLLDLEGGAGSPAFESAGLVVRSLPADVRQQLTAVRATTADDVTLTLGSGLMVVWGSEESSVRKGVVLARVLAANPDASTIDVSSPRTAVVG